MDHAGVIRPYRELALLLLVLLPAVAFAGPLTLTQVVQNEFTGAPSGPILPYKPFDATLGLLLSADVTVEGWLELSLLLPPANPPDPAPVAYEAEIRNQLEAAAFARGFGFDAPGEAVLFFTGQSLRSVPIPLSRFFSYHFTVTPQTDPVGLAPLRTQGIEVPPSQMQARLEHFIDTRCEGSPASHQSALAIHFGTFLPPDLFVLLPPTFSGLTRITYEFIPTDSLLDSLQNGDFEAASFSPWVVDGAGTAALSSPVECLQASLNQLLVLTAGSAVRISQAVDTPLEAFDLVFDYAFPEGVGQLDVWIGDTQVDSVPASPLLIGFRTRQISVGDPGALGLTGAPLSFEWNGPTGARAWLDNVRLLAVPEPSRVVLQIACLLVLELLVQSRRLRGGPAGSPPPTLRPMSPGCAAPTAEAPRRERVPRREPSRSPAPNRPSRPSARSAPHWERLPKLHANRHVCRFFPRWRPSAATKIAPDTSITSSPGSGTSRARAM